MVFGREMEFSGIYPLFNEFTRSSQAKVILDEERQFLIAYYISRSTEEDIRLDCFQKKIVVPCLTFALDTVYPPPQTIWVREIMFQERKLVKGLGSNPSSYLFP